MLRGLANPTGPSGLLLSRCIDRRLVVLLSKPVLAEYRRVLNSDWIVEQHPRVTPTSVKTVLRRLEYVSEFIGISRVRFRFDRDPLDEKFIELAIGGSASHLVTSDKDLLSLRSGHTDACKRFRQRLPQIRVVGPEQFVRENGLLLED